MITKDRKSTRLNSSHRTISYAVFCLKKKQETLPLRQAAVSGPAGMLPTLQLRIRPDAYLQLSAIRPGVADASAVLVYLPRLRPQESTLFPYTTLFRSGEHQSQDARPHTLRDHNYLLLLPSGGRRRR